MLSLSKTHKEDTDKFYNISVFVLKHHLYLYLQSSDRRRANLQSGHPPPSHAATRRQAQYWLNTNMSNILNVKM